MVSRNGKVHYSAGPFFSFFLFFFFRYFQSYLVVSRNDKVHYSAGPFFSFFRFLFFFIFYFLLTLGLVVWQRLDDPSVSQNPDYCSKRMALAVNNLKRVDMSLKKPIKIRKEFPRFIFQDGFWVVNIPFICKVKSKHFAPSLPSCIYSFVGFTAFAYYEIDCFVSITISLSNISSRHGYLQVWNQAIDHVRINCAFDGILAGANELKTTRS